MRIAYLENRLTEVGKTFIRSEMTAVAALGHDVRPFSGRTPSARERAMTEPEMPGPTTYLFEQGVRTLAGALLREARANPRRTARAAALAWRSSAKGLRGRTRALAQFAAGVLLGRTLRAQGAEHLHNHAIHTAPVALVASTISGIPYSVTTHGPPEFDAPAEPCLSLHAAHAAFIATISPIVRAEVCRLTAPHLWERIKIVRCGLPEAFLAQAPDDPAAEPVFACVARLDGRKGQLVLLEAVHRLVAGGHDVRVVLIGDGPLRGELETALARTGLEDRVRITGWQPSAQVRDELRRARALVLPSFAEGLPIAIMEAMALGRPVVATAVGSVPEIVRPGETGWLVPPLDTDALHDALLEVVTTPLDTLRTMGRRGAALVRERHNAATQAARLIELIHDPAQP